VTTLTKAAINGLLERDKDPLIITPILSKGQIGEASIDVRLGNQFIVFKSHRFQLFSSAVDSRVGPHRIQDRQIVAFGGDPFILQPGTLALGSTLEYVSIPGDVEVQVEGRSSWARIGLQIATANSVEPGFKGVVTLELSNVSGIALEIRPGVRIAQLVFHKASPPVDNPYAGARKYRYPVGPQFSRVFEDYDLKIFNSSNQKL